MWEDRGAGRAGGTSRGRRGGRRVRARTPTPAPRVSLAAAARPRSPSAGRRRPRRPGAARGPPGRRSPATSGSQGSARARRASGAGDELGALGALVSRSRALAYLLCVVTSLGPTVTKAKGQSNRKVFLDGGEFLS